MFEPTFDLNDETLARVKHGDPIDRMEVEAAQAPEEPNNPLDSGENRLRHARLMDYYRQELERQSENRYEQAMDEDYYDNIQWSDADARTLEERGQQPTVYNVISTAVNWIIGSEKRGRTDFKILPRGKEDAKPAEAKTKFMKYLSDVNRTPFNRSRAFEDAVKVGIGWVEEAVQDEDDGEPIYCRYESWRNVLFDSASTELDGRDMRYCFRSKWVDEDIAVALFPDRKEAISRAVIESTLMGAWELQDGDMAMDYPEFSREDAGILNTVIQHKRRRLRLIEAWYRVPEQVKKLRGGAFNGEIFDEADPRHTQQVQAGLARVVTKTMMRVRVAIMTSADLLWEGPSPFRHNRFKFIPIWGYRRGRDGLPYGMIRGMRDIQDGVNKAKSKAQYILATNKIIMDEGALPEGTTIDDLAEEAAKPDAIIVKRKGYELTMNADVSLAAPHLEMMSRDIQFMQTASGVTDELLGRQTNASSGVAIERRQEQGSLATSKFFDNLRFAEQLRGELELSLIEQFATEQKQFRITNMRGTPEFVTINDGLPENDITRTKADFVISEAEWRASMREAAAAELGEMLMKMPPEVALAILDLFVENMDLPNRDEIVKRIRQINGQRDPDATELTPEEQAAQQAAAEQAAAQKAMFEAELAGKQADAAKKAAEASRIEAQTIGDRVGATKSAMEAATNVLTMPTIARVADNLLAEAGWPQAQVPIPAHPAAQGIAPNGMVQEQTAPAQPPVAQPPQ